MINMQSIWEYLYVARAGHTLICYSPTDEQLKTEKLYYDQLMTWAAALAIKGGISEKNEAYFLDMGWIGKTKERFTSEYNKAKNADFTSLSELEPIFGTSMHDFSKAYKLLTDHFNISKISVNT